MGRHIHIHFEGNRKPATHDAGWDESKHKRDHGKFASKAGAGTETHHTKLKPGHGLYDKSGQKVDEVERIEMARGFNASEKLIFTRAGYEHTTKEGHLPNGLHAKPAHQAAVAAKQVGAGAAHPKEEEMAKLLKAGLGRAKYQSPRGDSHWISHYDDKDDYRAGMMKSKTLSGLLHLIDKKVK